MYEKAKIVACIPAFKEEMSIAKVILSAQKYVDHVLVCDDGSPDMTGEIAEKVGAFVIRHGRNMGKGNSIKSLFNEAHKYEADVIVLLDADGQHDPHEIPMLVKPIVQGQADFVIGSRYSSKWNQIPLYRRIGLKIVDYLTNYLMKISSMHVCIEISDTQCGFRAISRKTLEILSSFNAKGFGVESEMLALAAKNDLRVVEVPINVRYAGLHNTSKRSPLMHGGELITTILKLIVEGRPLMYLGIPGIVLISIGILLGAYLLWYFSIPAVILMLGTSLLGSVLVIQLKKINSRLKSARYKRV